MAKRDWSQLPEDMLAKVSTNLDNHIEFLQFRAVCHSWRSSTSLVPTSPAGVELPYPIIPAPNPFIIHNIHFTDTHFHSQVNDQHNEDEEDDDDYEFEIEEENIMNMVTPPDFYCDYEQENRLGSCMLTLVEHTIYAVQPLHQPEAQSSSSPKGWIIKVKETRPNVFQFLEPLSGCPIKVLPNSFPKMLNTLDFKIYVIGKEYHLEKAESEREGRKAKQSMDHFGVRKLVFSRTATSSDFVVMAIHSSGKLVLFRSGDNNWSVIEYQEDKFQDLIHYRGKFYAVETSGRTYIVDPHTKNVSLVTHSFLHGGNKVCFLESLGNLYVISIHANSSPILLELRDGLPNSPRMVWEEEILNLGIEMKGIPTQICSIHKAMKCNVYKLDDRGDEWGSVKSLGDRIFLVGGRSSFSVSASDFLPGCEGKCFLLTHSHFTRQSAFRTNQNFVNQGIGVYNLADGSIRKLDDIPNYPQLFWPPPMWTAVL